MAEIISSATNLSPKLRAMREKALESLPYFNSEVMRFDKTQFGLTAPIHVEMDEWLQDVFTDPRRYHLMLDARGYGKTVKGGAGHTLWRCVRNSNIQIRYMHADEETARNPYSIMRGALETNETLRTLFAREIFQPTDDGGRKLVIDNEGFTLNRSYAPLTPTLIMLGYKSGKIGSHVDLFVLDDLVNEKTSASEVMMESVRHFIRTLPPLLNDPVLSRILLLGTRWDLNDAYGMLMESAAYAPKCRSWVKSCFTDDTETESRWPTKFSVEVLRDMEVEMTPPFFSANMRNEPIPRGTQVFDVSKVQRYELRLDERMRPILPTGLPYLVYAAVDPNRTKFGDACALLTVARDADDNHFVLDLMYGRPESTELVVWMRQNYLKWKPIATMYEALCGQGMLLPWIKRDMLESGVVYPLQESNRSQTITRKSVRIRALSHVINTGKLYVPQSVIFKPLLREIECYTDVQKDPKDDCLDCLADIYGDGFAPAGGTREQARRVDQPFNGDVIDSMLVATWGARLPRVVSVESQAYRGR